VKVAHQALVDPRGYWAINNVLCISEQRRRLNLASIVRSQLLASSISVASVNTGGCLTKKSELGHLMLLVLTRLLQLTGLSVLLIHHQPLHESILSD
jgi:hypothetical protein